VLALKKGLSMDGESLTDVKLRLIAELMRNSRRSDRKLAKALGVY
jgi:DNA-binding Lrp family transcriptional regulator